MWLRMCSSMYYQASTTCAILIESCEEDTGRQSVNLQLVVNVWPKQCVAYPWCCIVICKSLPLS